MSSKNKGKKEKTVTKAFAQGYWVKVMHTKRGQFGGWRAKVLRVTDAKLFVSVFGTREQKWFLKELCFVIPSEDDKEEAQIASEKLSWASKEPLAGVAAVVTRARQVAAADATAAARRARDEADVRPGVGATDGGRCLGGQLAIEKEVDGASRHGYTGERGDQDDANGWLVDVGQGGDEGVGGPSLPRGGAEEGGQGAGLRR
jgi:hypothetical protein